MLFHIACSFHIYWCPGEWIVLMEQNASVTLLIPEPMALYNPSGSASSEPFRNGAREKWAVAD